MGPDEASPQPCVLDLKIDMAMCFFHHVRRLKGRRALSMTSSLRTRTILSLMAV